MSGEGAQESDLVALVRRAFECFEAGNTEGMLEVVHPSAEFLPVFVDERAHRGRDSIRGLLEGPGSRRRWRVDELELVTVGERVVGDGRLHSMTTIGTAEDYPIAFVIEFAEGRIVRMQSFVHRRQAMAAIAAIA